MKTLLTILASIIISCQCFAHGEIQFKSSCTWGWKYKVKCRVSHFGIPAFQIQKSCTGCPLSCSKSNHCASQTIGYCHPSYSFGGSVTSHYGHCGRGYSLSPMMQRLFKLLPFAPPPLSPRDSLNNTEKSDLSFTTVSETTTSYTIKINGTMQITGSEPTSEIELLVWKPNHSGGAEDTIIDGTEILWRAFARIVEGRLILEDEFVGDRMIFYSASNQNQTRFKFEPRVPVIEGPNGPELGEPIGGGPGGGIGEPPGGPPITPNPPTVSVTTLRFANFQKKLTWPASEKKDSLVIVLRSHAEGPDATRGERITHVIENTNIATDIKFDVFPNPATSSFDVFYMIASDGAAELSIFNELGEFIGVPDKKYLGKGKIYNSHYDVNALGLSNGIYYIMLQTDGKVYLRKMIITGK